MSQTRAKGTDWENRSRDYLQSRGINVTREEFSSPLGDLRGCPVVIECKARQKLELSVWIRQAQKSLAKTPWRLFVIIHKRQNHRTPDCYFTTTLEHGATLLKAYTYL